MLSAPARVDGEHEQELGLVKKRLHGGDGRPGIHGHTADDPRARETLQDAVRVACRFDMEGDNAGAGLHIRMHLLERLVDHQVDVLHESVG